MHIFYKFDAPT